MNSVSYRGENIPEPAVSDLTGDSFFASPGFASLWEAHGGRRVIRAVEDEAGICAVLPGIEIGRRPVRRFLAMPNGLYARVYVRQDCEQHRARIGRMLAEGLLGGGYARVHLHDYHMDTLPGQDLFDTRPVVTTLVDVGDPEWEPPDRKLRSEVRKAEREGVVGTRFAWDLHGGGFMDLVRRKGGEEKYPEAFWERLAEVATENDRVRWYYCEREGNPVTSHVYFIEGSMLLGWQMYYDRAYSELKANPHIIVQAVNEARDRGISTLNLGATPEGASGTAFFKDRWGGYDYEYRVLSAKRGVGRVL
jgi:hypothetical protein